MHIKPLRSMVGSYGSVRRGVVAEIPDRIAQQLVKRGVAVPVQAGEAKKEAAKMAAGNPQARQTGGQTGGAKRSSSSPAVQAPKNSRSTK